MGLGTLAGAGLGGWWDICLCMGAVTTMGAPFGTVFGGGGKRTEGDMEGLAAEAKVAPDPPGAA